MRSQEKVTTKREAFLNEMERVVPWSRLLKLIEPYYPKAGNGSPPMPMETMLRIYFLQQWYSLSDPAAEGRIQLRSATLLLRSLHQFSKDGLRLLEAKACPRSQVQPPFYPGYKLIADRSHIGSLRDVLPEQPVKVLIQPALPR